MPATLGDVITEVRYLLRSFSGQHERSTYLTSAITDTATSLPLSDGSVVQQGLVEIDDELLYVESSSSGSATVPPYGRGYMGTTAAAHDADAQVIVDPFFPKKSIQDAVNHTLRAMYPRLFAVDTTDLTATVATSYELPATAERVISGSWEVTGDSGFWQPLKRWRVDNAAQAAAFSTEKAIHIADRVPAGRTIRVVYTRPFTEFTDSSTTLASVGMQESHRDVLVYGAAWRLLQFLEVERQNLEAVGNQERAQYVPPGSASALARQVLALYERRLDEERTRLRELYPFTPRFTR